MKKTLLSLLAVLMVVSLVVAACGPPAEPTRAPEPTKEETAPEPTVAEEPTQEDPEGPVLKGTVNLWHAWEEHEIESLYEVIATFAAKNPGVEFEVRYVPFDDLRDQYETAATGGGPSVLIGAPDWGPALFDAELVAEVTDLTSEEFLRTINPAALGAVNYRNALIGLPQTIKGVVMYRNSDIIADAPATYEDLVAAAQAATTDDIVGANLERGSFFSAAHLNGVGGQLMDEAGDPLFNDEKGVEWINLLDSFSDAGPTEYYTDNDANLFKAGQAGIIIDSTWNMAGLAEAIGADKLSIDPWPTLVRRSPLRLRADREYLSERLYGGCRQGRRLGVHGVLPLARGPGPAGRPDQGGSYPGDQRRRDHRSLDCPGCRSPRRWHGLPGHPRNGHLLGANGHRSAVGL